MKIAFRKLAATSPHDLRVGMRFSGDTGAALHHAIDPLLRTAQERILDWWNAAYRENPDHPLAERFALEASVSLPGVVAADADLDSYYSALNLQRLRLKQNQQVPEWSGTPYL